MHNPTLQQRNKSALVIIDMQYIFQDSASQWYVEDYTKAEQQIKLLLENSYHKVIWTKFIRDPKEEGIWEEYYNRWDQCRYEESHAIWQTTLPIDENHHIISLPSFSKWGKELQNLTHDCEQIILTGVVTDCCVLSTALGAIDSGKKVIIPQDACAGTNLDIHKKTLDVLHMLNPMIHITTSKEIPQAMSGHR